MSITTSEKIYNTSKILINSGSNFITELNRILNEFMPCSYKAATGSIVDILGIKSDNFGTLVFTISTQDKFVDAIEVQNDSLACIIDFYEELTLENFRTAYYRISNAKKLHKSSNPQNNGKSRKETLGIILSVRTTLPLEMIANELEHLNQKTSCSEWPEIIGVLTQGTISYAVQFPGEQGLFPFLLPSSDLLTQSQPGFYVVPVISPTGHYTLNKIFSFIFTQLNIFLPGTDLPTINEVMGNTSRTNLTLAGYQFNLKGELLPVPPNFYIGRYLPQPVQIFKDKKHNIVFNIQFMPWQDGGIILLQGKVPLEGLLIYLGEKAKNRVTSIKRNNLQISGVLPITIDDYSLMLQRINNQTTFKLQKPDKKIIKQTIANEGASSPFIARLLIGIPMLRDSIFLNTEMRDKFDNIYHPMVMKLWNLKTTTQEIINLFTDHSKRVDQCIIARIEENDIRISESIDQKLIKDVESFINEASRIFKQGMQSLIKFLGIDIGFMYQKKMPYEKGLNLLIASQRNLATYLKEVRKWSEKLIEIRNKIEHEWWVLPNVKYEVNENSIQVIEPTVLDQPVIEFVKFIFDRLTCFVEEVTVHSLQLKLPEGISFLEIDPSKRNFEMPIRFRIVVTTSNTVGWTICCNNSFFENK
jgi:hypothetical protein